MRAYVLTAGGHARVVISLLKSLGRPIAGVADRDPELQGMQVLGIPVIGDDETILALESAETELYNGIGNRARSDESGLEPRRKLFEHFAALGYTFPPLVAPDAAVAAESTVADGAQIMQGAIVQPLATIGENAIVNSGAIVEHDCKVGAHAHVAPGAILCGGVAVGSGTHIGAGAIILQNVKIAGGIVVPAGAVVRADLGSHGRI